MTIQGRALFFKIEGIEQIEFNGRQVKTIELNVILKDESHPADDSRSGIIYQCGSSEFVLN